MKYIITLLSVFCLLSCEREYTPEDLNQNPDIVVEGHIEAGDNPLPPYVILTNSLSFFSSVNINTLDNFFVHDAKVVVSDGTKDYTLTELCLNNLTPPQKIIAAQAFNLNPDSLRNSNLCIYLDLSGQLQGKEGGTYNLTVKKAEKTLTATTTIPKGVALDSIVSRITFNNEYDSLRQVRGFLSDPNDTYNAYRIFARNNESQLIANGFGSVVDDRLFDGKQSFEFPLNNPVRRNAAPNETEEQKQKRRETSGLWKVGDTATFKWCSIDQEHFKFWDTLESARNNQGPFSTYTRVDYNIEGGLGIWGGYGVRYYTMKIK